jgi:hypothetical protein
MAPLGLFENLIRGYKQLVAVVKASSTHACSVKDEHVFEKREREDAVKPNVWHP